MSLEEWLSFSVRVFFKPSIALGFFYAITSDMKKYSISALIVIVAIVSFIILSNKKPSPVDHTTVATSTATTSSSTPPLVIESLPGRILLGDRSKYENLSVDEKKLVDSVIAKHPEIYTSLLDMYGGEILAKNYFELKYHDSETFALAVPTGKVGLVLNIYSVDSFEILESDASANVYFFGNSQETENYIIAAGDSQFTYYKKGEKHASLVKGSFLDMKKETYAKLGGFGSTHDFTFDDVSKTITASVFAPVFKEGKENPKIRTVKFVLP